MTPKKLLMPNVGIMAKSPDVVISFLNVPGIEFEKRTRIEGNWAGKAMKTSWTLLFLAITPFLFGQSDDKIDQIRTTVEQINKDTAYTTKSLDNEQFLEHTTDGGAQLTGYFKNGQLVKVWKQVGLSSCVTNYEYYFQDNILLFVYGQEQVFAYVDSIGSFDYTTKTLGMEADSILTTAN